MTEDASVEPSKTTKRIFFVRHAQSEQNIATCRLKSGDLTAAFTLVGMGYDAPVSETGVVQLSCTRTELDGLVEKYSIALVVHSPLQRAVETAKAVFGGRGPPLVEFPGMYERTVSEYLLPTLMDQRIVNLQRWLATRDETVIALVGHGQFFKRCLGASQVLQNVAIVECSFDSPTGFSSTFDRVFDGYPDPDSELRCPTCAGSRRFDKLGPSPDVPCAVSLGAPHAVAFR